MEKHNRSIKTKIFKKPPPIYLTHKNMIMNIRRARPKYKLKITKV